MRTRSLKLVWDSGATLVDSKKRRNERAKVADVQSTPKRSVNWITVSAFVVALVSAIVAGGFYFGTLQMRTEFGERIAGVETNFKGLEKKIDFIFEKYVLRNKELQTKATKLLKAENLQFAYVNLRSNVVFPAPDIKPSPTRISVQDKKTTMTVLVIYTIEGVIGDSLIIRGQIKDEKFEKTLYDRRIQIRLPTDEKRVTYDFRFELTPGPVHTPPVRLEIVVLERLSPTDLIIATGLDTSPPSAS